MAAVACHLSSAHLNVSRSRGGPLPERLGCTTPSPVASWVQALLLHATNHDVSSPEGAVELFVVEVSRFLAESLPTQSCDEVRQFDDWSETWRQTLERWLAGVSFSSALRDCFGAFGLHLGSRLTGAFKRWHGDQVSQLMEPQN